MKKVVVDTDILIDYLRAGKGPLVKLIEFQVQKKLELYISSMSIFELFAGKSSIKGTIKVLGLVKFFKVIPVSAYIGKLAGELKRDNNLTIAAVDLLIGTSALSIRAIIATRNRKHFKGIAKLKFYEV